MSWLSVDCHHRITEGFSLDVQFEINHPVAALFGPSGSGKTSILEMVAGLRCPTNGRIQIGGRTVFDSTQKINLPIHKRQVGIVFQDHRLFPHYTVEKNLLYGSQRQNHSLSVISISQVIDVLDLGEILHRYPRNLSGGEKQRVALGRALLSNPEILLLDEPLSAIDDNLKDRILTYIDRIVNEWKIPTLLVSHSLYEVQRLADWVVILDRGKVVSENVFSQLFDSHPFDFSANLGKPMILPCAI